MRTPPMIVTVHPDGTGELNLGNQAHTVRTSSVDQARKKLIDLAAAESARAGAPLKVIARGPDGEFALIVHPNGQTQSDPHPAKVKPVARHVPPAIVNDPDDLDTQLFSEQVHAVSEDEDSSVPAAPETAPSHSAESTTHMPLRWEAPAQAEQPARTGWRGAVNALGWHLAPGPLERSDRAHLATVGAGWSGTATISVVNPKGGAGKTPTWAFLSAVFAKAGIRGVALEGNLTRGTATWRTQQESWHDSTARDLVARLDGGSVERLSDLTGVLHHQPEDQYDVLLADPTRVAAQQGLTRADFVRIHEVLSRYYRLIVQDTSNDDSSPVWLQLVNQSDALVVPTTTRFDHVRSAQEMLATLLDGDERQRELARTAIILIGQGAKHEPKPATVLPAFAGTGAKAIQIGYDAGVGHGALRYDALQASTRRAYLEAAAALAERFHARSRS